MDMNMNHKDVRWISILNAILYVLPFYLFASLRASPTSPRDHPTSIRNRSRAVWLTCLLCLTINYFFQAHLGQASGVEMLHRMGVLGFTVMDVVRCMMLVGVLFAGPLFERVFVEREVEVSWRRWTGLASDWIVWRNFVVGPVSEEIIFRAVNVSLMLYVQDDPWHIIIVAPLIFGVAHIHHFNEFIVMNKRSNQSYLSAVTTIGLVLPGLARSLFQFGYTTVFGMFVTFVLLRTGNIYSCILAHSFCNWMGLPRLWGKVGQQVGEEFGYVSTPRGIGSTTNSRGDGGDGMKLGGEPPLRHRKTSSAAAAVMTQIVGATVKVKSLGIHWSIAYYLLLFAGMWGFWTLLFPLTASRNALQTYWGTGEHDILTTQ